MYVMILFFPNHSCKPNRYSENNYTDRVDFWYEYKKMRHIKWPTVDYIR